MKRIKSKKKKRFFISVVLVVVSLLGVMFLGGCGANDKANDNVVVKTKYGNFVGLTQDSGVVSFLGVPYAKQPVGDLRWQEAQPMNESNDYVKCYKYGKTAIQPVDEYERASFTEQGEDCLSLNVWTKDVTEKKPTMVFIHGGANVNGGTADPLYDGENFAKNNDVCMVSINYRLGAFGFLDLSKIGGKEYAHSRNLGILDQLAALKWIQANIEKFGGDPKNVTVFGESAGASTIIRLTATPRAQGLFQKAIIESGGTASIKFTGSKNVDEVAQSQKVAQKFLEVTGKKDVQGLQSLTASEVQEYANKLADEIGDDLDISTWGAIADDYAFPKDVYQNIKDGVGKDVKIIIGSNRDELLYFKLYDPNIEKSFEEEYPGGTALGKDFSKNKKYADAYIANHHYDSNKYVDFASELWIREPSMIFAELQSKYNDVYMYEWQYESKVKGLKACHAVELAYVFGNFDAAEAIAYSGENLPKKLSTETQAVWTEFAKSGSPNIEGHVNWDKYNDKTRMTIFIDNNDWHMVKDPRPEGHKYLHDMYLVTHKQ